MKIFISIMLSAFMVQSTIALSYARQNIEEEVKNAIVKIYTVSSNPDYYSPWKTNDHESFTGSGCIIKGNRILTNAHVVNNQNFIQVQLNGKPERYKAKVLYVSHEVDLALLTVEDSSFFHNTKPLKVGDLPETLQSVLVYGYPTGGDSLSITKGVLSRIEYERYTQSYQRFMAGQIDAAINPGNSGGPVVVDGKIVGIAMQKNGSEGIDNIGYMVPAPIIEHFLTDVQDGQYDGFPDSGFVAQNMENPSMRKKYLMTDKQTGILVSHVHWNFPVKELVRKGDVLLSIDGRSIANDETVEFRDKERITYKHYFDIHQVGDEITLEILRDGKVKNIKYPLSLTKGDVSLIAPMQYDMQPRYFIFGGLVFSPVSFNLICEADDCNPSLDLIRVTGTHPTREKRGVVVMLQVLPAEINKGYHDLSTWIVEKVNQKGFKDFTEFYNLIVDSRDEFIVLENDKGKQIVLDRKKAIESNKDILEAYDIDRIEAM